MYFLQGAKRWFAFAVFFACMVSVMDLINPKIIGYTIDTILNGQPSTLPDSVNAFLETLGGPSFFKEHLYYVALAVICIALGGAVFRFLFRVCNSIAAETLTERMRNTLFDHILHLPFQWHSENHTGDIIQRCTSDVEQIKMFLSEQLVMLVRVIMLIIMALFFMSSISIPLTLTSFAFIPVIVGYSFFFHHKIGSQFRIVDEQEGKLSSIAQENLTGVRVVRAFGRESYEQERFHKQNVYYTNMWIRLLQYMAAFWSTGDIFSYAQYLAVILFGTHLCLTGELTAGSYVAFISYNMMLTWPVRSLGRIIANLSRAGISIDRLRYIMNSEEEKDLPDAIEPDMHADIHFDHVNYAYASNNTEILHDICLDVPAGSTLGILGGTGSGKSTLMYLLDRLYEIPQGNGSIRIGDTDIRNIKSDWLRKHIGMVLQEPYLFSRTLSENISIASQTSDMMDVRNAARIASLDETVDHFAEGYDTFVGERGVTLSGGQKQRTAIAQMLIRKPPVMVFDDSLSAVDAETDAKIRAAMKENVQDATVILIAHRITTLMNADQIIVMDQGRIIERGTHEELLAQNGVYKKIYDLQSQQGEIEEEAEHE